MLFCPDGLVEPVGAIRLAGLDGTVWQVRVVSFNEAIRTDIHNGLVMVIRSVRSDGSVR